MGNDNLIFDDMLKLKEAVIFIRKESIKGNLVEKISLAETAGIEEGEVEPLLARMLDFPEFIELKRVMDSEGNEYLYSASEMTDRYVEILMGLKNKDLLKLIAETVRYESQKYPRPTRADLFTKKPYNISLEELGELLDSSRGRERLQGPEIHRSVEWHPIHIFRTAHDQIFMQLSLLSGTRCFSNEIP